MLLLGFLAAQVAQHPVASAKPVPEEVVVTGTRTAPAPRPEPIDHFRDLCFDPSRRTGRVKLPVGRGWEPALDDLRAQLGISPSALPYDLIDTDRGETLLLKIEAFPSKRDVVENRCTLIVVGGTSHARLESQISKLFSGPGTQRHLGRADGYKSTPGWREILWTGAPDRRSSARRSINNGRRAGPPSYHVVTDLSYYDRYDYVALDLKTGRRGGRPISMLTLAHISRPLRSAR